MAPMHVRVLAHTCTQLRNRRPARHRRPRRVQPARRAPPRRREAAAAHGTRARPAGVPQCAGGNFTGWGKFTGHGLDPGPAWGPHSHGLRARPAARPAARHHATALAPPGAAQYSTAQQSQPQTPTRHAQVDRLCAMRRVFDACGEGAATAERLQAWRRLQDGAQEAGAARSAGDGPAQSGRCCLQDPAWPRAR
jgi:hypothetical protein